jgi:hypothetical protein
MRPHIQNNCQYTWTYAINSGGTIYSSLPIIASRISLFVLTYLIVVSVPAETTRNIQTFHASTHESVLKHYCSL